MWQRVVTLATPISTSRLSRRHRRWSCMWLVSSMLTDTRRKYTRMSSIDCTWNQFRVENIYNFVFQVQYEFGCESWIVFWFCTIFIAQWFHTIQITWCCAVCWTKILFYFYFEIHFIFSYTYIKTSWNICWIWTLHCNHCCQHSQWRLFFFAILIHNCFFLKKKIEKLFFQSCSRTRNINTTGIYSMTHTLNIVRRHKCCLHKTACICWCISAMTCFHKILLFYLIISLNALSARTKSTMVSA